MPESRVAARRVRNRNRILAISAAGTLLAAGITIPSLAAWTDIEWVTGGVGEDAGITAGTFEVQQLTVANAGAWGDYETEAGANVIDFGTVAAGIAPGDTVYGWVQLRTKIGSLGGDLTLQADTTVVAGELSDELSYGARVVDTTTDCTQTGFAASTTVLQADATALDSSAGGTLTLAASDGTNPGTAQTVCFAINFAQPPAGTDLDDLMGDTVAPVWHFDAVSIATP